MNWANYLIQINLYLMLFYCFYFIFLKNETFFMLNRVYLLGSAFFSAFIPLIQTQWVKSLFITEKVQDGWQNVNFSVMQGFASPIQEESAWALGDFLTLIYIITVMGLIIRLAIKLYGVKQMFNSENHPEAFSFFRKIRVNPDLPNREQIEKHEETHAQQLHSADVLFFELLSIINWFNPVVYLYKKSIRQIHEFIADEQALVKAKNKQEYALLLFSKSFGINPNQLTNNFFNQSLLKRRIQMIQKPKSRKAAILKYGLSAPLFLLAMILSSATISENKTIKEISNNIKPKTLGTTIISSSEDLKAQNPKQTSVKIAEKLSPIISESPIKIDTIPNKTDQVFTNVEQLPTYPGGLKEFQKFLSENLKYPETARKNNIQGRVFLNFVIEKDGSLSDIKVVRGIGYGCDEEAVRVLAISPKWNPGVQNGKVVRVSYTIPIFFQMTGSLVTTDPKNLSPEEIQKNKENIMALLNKDVLIILDGEIIDREGKTLNQLITPSEIASMNVLKGENATKKYGDKGKDGAIEITSKKKE